MRAIMVNFWQLLKFFKSSTNILKVINMKFLFLQTIIIDATSQIQKVIAIDKVIKLKICLNTISRLMIIKAKQRQLSMFFLDIQAKCKKKLY